MHVISLTYVFWKVAKKTSALQHKDQEQSNGGNAEQRQLAGDNVHLLAPLLAKQLKMLARSMQLAVVNMQEINADYDDDLSEDSEVCYCLCCRLPCLLGYCSNVRPHTACTLVVYCHVWAEYEGSLCRLYGCVAVWASNITDCQTLYSFAYP